MNYLQCRHTYTPVHYRRIPVFWKCLFVGISSVLLLAGCGTTKSFEATEQLLLSDAVDASVSAIDFRPLAGQTVYLDTKYVTQIKPPTIVNADYVISSLRQQMFAGGCLLQDTIDQADIVVEPRVGTLGSDSFQVTYGIPSNSALATAAQAIPTAPPIPVIPELSVARRESREGAVKIAAFAYDRLSRQPLWQSGISRSSTTSRDTWLMGIGPIQTGTIRGRTRILGSGLEFGTTSVEGATPRNLYDRPPVNLGAEVRYEGGVPILGPRFTNEGMLQSIDTLPLGESSASMPAANPTGRMDEPAQLDASRTEAPETLPPPPELPSG